MNVTAVMDGNSTSGTFGQVVERYAYDPYGRATVLNGPADKDSGVSDWSADADGVSDVDSAILFCGYWRDSETGLYHVRNRPYHPLLGRWLQRAPPGYVDGMSLYEYVASQPFHTDPMGYGVGEFLTNVGKAIWEAVKYIVPGSESTSALELAPGVAKVAMAKKLQDRTIELMQQEKDPETDPQCVRLKKALGQGLTGKELDTWKKHVGKKSSSGCR